MEARMAIRLETRLRQVDGFFLGGKPAGQPSYSAGRPPEKPGCPDILVDVSDTPNEPNFIMGCSLKTLPLTHRAKLGKVVGLWALEGRYGSARQRKTGVWKPAPCDTMFYGTLFATENCEGGVNFFIHFGLSEF